MVIFLFVFEGNIERTFSMVFGPTFEVSSNVNIGIGSIIMNPHSFEF